MKLKIEGLSAGYDKDFVIKDLSLSVNQGEFLSLLGPSGCGKTTLMKAVAGILPAQGGRILLDGEDITGLPIHKRGTVIVFQDMRLFPHMTVEENVAFPLKMQGVSRTGRCPCIARRGAVYIGRPDAFSCVLRNFCRECES